MWSVILCTFMKIWCVYGCDMVPPVKMVHRATNRTPIPTEIFAIDACIVQKYGVQNVSLWQPSSQWYAPWNDTNQLKKYSFPMWQPPGQAPNQSCATKLIGETPISQYMPALGQER